MNDSVDLTVQECRALLADATVGRVALCTPAGPRIVPVSYVLHDDAIIFRTAAYTELGTYGRGSEVAFEVDRLDEGNHRGWSVVAAGGVVVIDDPDEVAEIRAAHEPAPWVAGQRHLYCRLQWRTLTGRRVGR
ncbi:MAG TPA: pyridoxamine 5'-phosphate oxidase family protein [Nocardioidaceae bacterium]|nr:pyridoxamine 5'-phosphate oxidase family protein [Nocardioidaceae bacterium]